MPKRGRPISVEFDSTEPLLAFDRIDIYATRDLANTALAEADDGPEGLVELFATVGQDDVDAVTDILDRRYARGVTDALYWLAGGKPTTELLELLDVKDD
jgi:hypothetical protein